jgi:hypothetical protein
MKRAIILITTILLTNCTFSTTYIDRDKDKKRAVALTKEFYLYADHNEMDKVFSLFNIDPRQASSVDKKKQIYIFLRSTAEKLGKVESMEIISNSTKVVESSRIYGEYKLAFKVKRANMPTFFKDTFTLVSDGNQIKIADYFINSI